MKVTYHDIEAVDPDYYKNLKWMLEVTSLIRFVLPAPFRTLLVINDIFPSPFFFFVHQNDVSEIPDLTFSMDADEEKHILYEKTEVHFLYTDL